MWVLTLGSNYKFDWWLQSRLSGIIGYRARRFISPLLKSTELKKKNANKTLGFDKRQNYR